MIGECDNIKQVVQKNNLTQELEKYNEDVAKYNKISAIIKDDFESKKEKFKKKREKNHYSQTKKKILTQFVNWFRNFIDNAE